MFIIVLLILIQIGLIAIFALNFNHLYLVNLVVSVLCVLWVLSSRSNPAFKIAWVIPILLFPLLGAAAYFIFGGQRINRGLKNKMNRIEQKIVASFQRLSKGKQPLEPPTAIAANQSRYIANQAHFPIYTNTSSEYLPLGEVKFERMVEELKKAKHYIFLEYFIIQEGKMWNTILEVLLEKVAEGVEVRLIYDGVGCLRTLPGDYNKKLEALGIQCEIFIPFNPALSTRMNNRDHRKICVIDGVTGFTGGINLADEYINAYVKHGHWKDSAIMLKGDAVWNLTVMFLSMWEAVREVEEDYLSYRPQDAIVVESDGFVQPFSDNPLINETVGETVYLNLVNKAQDYVYITTPYLIIASEMITALTTAGKSGVDVRIIMPHIPDKRYVHAVSRSHYQILIESGVKIYEYTPGFIHAKSFVVDDDYGVVGTINMDFRSLYLHFECATWLYKTKSIYDIKADFLKTLAVCHEVTLEECHHVKWHVRFARTILSVFAPLM